MKELVFASNNAHKLQEIRDLLNGHYQILSLSDVGFDKEIEETADSLEGNSLIKAKTLYEFCGKDVFADDTGLEVYALDMQPGVFSARYAGEEKSDRKNMAKLLSELQHASDRKARFRTVITLIKDGNIHQFEGEVQGVIATEARGEYGFGYDPLFIPEGKNLRFAEMTADEKNELSHRGRAIQALARFLK